MENIQKIEDELRQGSISPHTSAEYRVRLAGEYSFLAGQLEDILRRKPGVWNQMRKEYKSDTATERAWESTEDGLNQTGLSLRMKRIEKMIQALNGIIRVAEGEAKNQF